MGAIGVPATISFADLYGYRGPGRKGGDTTDPSDVEKASGDAVPANGGKPAFSWLVLVALLVIIRVLWEKGG